MKNATQKYDWTAERSVPTAFFTFAIRVRIRPQYTDLLIKTRSTTIYQSDFIRDEATVRDIAGSNPGASTSDDPTTQSNETGSLSVRCSAGQV